ncbi:MAG: hypothetical protein HYR88_17285 [Verrucomicrobia bacterium]|nr:hypothetical protein [Verrucomicrobiota bacterium]MBI3870851.1 hypothetical protein [Verrucomicrobiota bacterium]
MALILSEVRYLSHSQHFLDRFTAGYGWAGRHHIPPFEVAGIYVDQRPTGDLSRERVQRLGLRQFPTIEEAITLGGSQLAVDGVVLVIEHGDYPTNAKGQKEYPRYPFFKRVVKVFENSGRSVPVFNDKHLSVRWNECVEMVEDSRRLRFPFLAGSSLPVTWRIPSLELPLDIPLNESVCVAYGGVDSYDIHALETAQCMSERRRGGERGVRSVQALRGPALWQAVRRRDRTRKLMFAALARSLTCRAPAGYTWLPPEVDWLQEMCPDAIGYFIEHRDGFQTSMFLLNGVVEDFNYAGMSARTGEIHSCQMYLPMPPRRSTQPNFFNPLVNNVEVMLRTGRAPYPIERTLLTSGMTLFNVESLHRGQIAVPTPELAVAYTAPRGSHFWRS